jgi:hypothetical protein
LPKKLRVANKSLANVHLGEAASCVASESNLAPRKTQASIMRAQCPMFLSHRTIRRRFLSQHPLSSFIRPIVSVPVISVVSVVAIITPVMAWRVAPETAAKGRQRCHQDDQQYDFFHFYLL